MTLMTAACLMTLVTAGSAPGSHDRAVGIDALADWTKQSHPLTANPCQHHHIKPL